MNKYLRWVAKIIFVLPMSLAFSCGSVQPIDLPPNTSAPSVGSGHKEKTGDLSTLGLRVVAEMAKNRDLLDLKKPDLRLDLQQKGPLDQTACYFQNQIVYADVIRLSNLHLFFVWPEVLQGNSIIHVTGSHRILNGNNQWVGNRNPIQAWFDVRSHRWYVDISELLEFSSFYSQKLVTSADTQVISLDLILSNQSKISLDIKFRAEKIYEKIKSN